MKKTILISGILLALIGSGFVAEAAGPTSQARITNGTKTNTGSSVSTSGYKKLGVYGKNNNGYGATTANAIVVNGSTNSEVIKYSMMPGEVVNQFPSNGTTSAKAKVTANSSQHEGAMTNVNGTH